jgi:prepilin-type N-terminal cleavage/methylation domain-containing protein
MPMKTEQRSRSRHHLQRGFTFVEVVVVLAILGIMMPVVFSILFTVAKQQSKIYKLSEAKQQGDFALAFMKSYIRDYGERIYKEDSFTNEACTNVEYPDNDHISTTGTNFFFTKKDTANDYFQFTLDGTSERLVFNDDGTKQDLTTGNVKVTNFSIACLRKTTTSLPFVIVSFTIYYTADLSTAKPEDIAVIDYKGIVKLR